MATIVLVEDDDDIRAVTARILHRAGHTVVEAADGAAGLQAVHTHQPQAVVTDIDMPVMSGVQLCLALRADSRTGRLPVVVVSGSLMPGDTRPVDAQATAILSKPFVSKELIACVEQALRTGHIEGQQPIVPR